MIKQVYYRKNVSTNGYKENDIIGIFPADHVFSEGELANKNTGIAQVDITDQQENVYTMPEYESNRKAFGMATLMIPRLVKALGEVDNLARKRRYYFDGTQIKSKGAQ